MKKIAYIAGGILIGFVLSTSAGAFADSVKSLVGKKVSGEYTVIVNGQKLPDKGAIIDGKANVPVRGISEALGADIKVSGKTITVTSVDGQSAEEVTVAENKYTGRSKSDLEEVIRVLREHVIPLGESGKDYAEKEIARLNSIGQTDTLDKWESELRSSEESITKAKNDLAQAEAALAALK
ncbi:stalk domain-containing protein [Paenibacillus xylanilyticus]|uniref:stalk domain-containing protein n=1 Tax=Paenibacillus xylanilyticus TaxID=248903 RepID=UPI00129DC34B|nr:stalk domain-containing protein [Paenibacillus xylanilyticus]